MNYRQDVVIAALVLASPGFSGKANAFSHGFRWSGRGGITNGNGNGNSNNGNSFNDPPPKGPNDGMSPLFNDDEGNVNFGNNILGASIFANIFQDQEPNENTQNFKEDEDNLMNDDDDDDITSESSLVDLGQKSLALRGGSSKPKKGNNDIVAGTKASFETTTSYWSDVFRNVQNRVKNILPQNDKNRQKNEMDDIDPRTIPVQSVEAPDSDILPETIVQSVAKRSGLVGSVLRPDRVKECARQLKGWYMQRGYILHSVTGATLNVDDGTAILNVEEPLLNDMPVDIQFAKEVIVDPDSGGTTTMKEYRAKMEKYKGRSLNKDEWTKITSGLNTTLVEVTGRTNPKVISKRLNLHPGQHFQWSAQRWRNVANSGIFSKIWRAAPIRMSDGSVQLQVIAQESPPRNLEYGVSRSMYTGQWEGELDFKHENLFGGGESLGLIVRRGAKDEEPSIIMRFVDDKFGLRGGYNVEVFSDYIATDREEEKNADAVMKNGKSEGEGEATPPLLPTDELDTDETNVVLSTVTSTDSLLGRKGIKYSVRGPLPQNIIARSSASASIEQTSTRKGRNESVGSATLSVGPFVRELPLGAMTSLSTSTTSGARVGTTSEGSRTLLPYSSASATSRQSFPLFVDRRNPSSLDVNVPVRLALQHTIMAATQHLPLHEAHSAGVMAKVRGYPSNSNGPVDSSITGTAEVRVPVTIPFQKDKLNQDGSVVLFGDWMIGNRKTGSRGYRKEEIFGKGSVGIGLRKSIQGIPLKYDFSLTKDGKVGAFLGLGRDWDIM